MKRNQADYNAAKAAMEKHQNSLSSKIFGDNPAKLRKYNRQMDEAQYNYNQNEAKYLDADARHERLKLDQKRNEKRGQHLEEKLQEKAKKYVEKYGDEDIKNLDILKVEKPKEATKFQSYDEWETAYVKARNETAEANKKYQNTVVKNNMFHPDEDGPVYKTEEDFYNGIIDKEATKTADALDRASRRELEIEGRLSEVI